MFPTHPTLSALIPAVKDHHRFRELKQILSNHRISKWASETRHGQERLYDACEKVLEALKRDEIEYWKRNTGRDLWKAFERKGEWPFQCKVKGVPGYYSGTLSSPFGPGDRLTPIFPFAVIKHPMDMGTMSHKLKELKYTSKSEFLHDANLIWDNCLLFNAQDVRLSPTEESPFFPTDASLPPKSAHTKPRI